MTNASEGWRRSLPWLALTYGVWAHVYFVARFAGRWVDSDTARLRVASDEMWASQTVPSLTEVYGSAVGHPLLAGFHARMLGISTIEYQQLVHPIVGVVTLLCALLLARALTDNHVYQATTVFLVGCAPEVLFETSRGSHGAFTQSAMLLLLAVSIKFQRGQREGNLGWAVLGFLVWCASALFNFKRAIIAASVILVIVAVLTFHARTQKGLMDTRPGTLPLILLALAGVTTGGIVAADWLQTAFSTAASEPLSLRAQSTEIEPDLSLLEYMRASWGSAYTYAAFSIWNPIVALGGFAAWIVIAIQQGKRALPPRPILVLWAAGLALGLWLIAVVIGSIVLNILHSNYPLRLFAILAMVCAFLAPLPRLAARTGVPRRLTRMVAAVFVAWLAVAGPIKATGEPSLSNHWRYFDGHEELVLTWMSSTGVTPPLWIGADLPGWENRLQHAYLLLTPWRDLPAIATDDRPHSVVVSRTEARHASEMGISFPDPALYHQLYDNGGASFRLIAA